MFNREYFEKLVKANIDLLEDKNHDYGNNNLLQTGIESISIRMTDKINRLRNLMGCNSNSINFESLSDTLRDLSNYGLLGQALLDNTIKPDEKIVYLAGPIDGINGDVAKSWRKVVTDHLTPFGIMTFNPVLPYGLPWATPGYAEFINFINKTAIDNSTDMIAYLNGPGKSIGTIREIEYCLHKLGPKFKTIVVYDKFDEHISLYDCLCFKTLSDAVSHITGVLINIDESAFMGTSS